jgi:DNA repair photolyase
MTYLKGRGAQIHPSNRFNTREISHDDPLGSDMIPDLDGQTVVRKEYPKTILNKVNSPDVHMVYSVNPYQGCEHGCSYCYARNTHEYHGLSAGIDFEQQIFAKPDAADLLRRTLSKKNYKPDVISLSGNTDCYQPVERKLRITRSLLKALDEFNNPVGLITKNSLILRDLDILKRLAEKRLVHVMISITTLDEKLRRKLEPRTVSSSKRLEVIRQLNQNGIPTGVMVAPVIPGLNSDEADKIISAAADHGALEAGHIIVRLNGSVKKVFHDWLHKNFPDRANKVWNLISSCHGGRVDDNRFGTRMSGEGKVAESINQFFRISRKKYLKGRSMPDYDLSRFKVPVNKKGQMELF